jgi:hypothetical protein
MDEYQPRITIASLENQIEDAVKEQVMPVMVVNETSSLDIFK